MKNILTVILAILFVFALESKANNDNLFDIDKTAIEQQFESVNQFEEVYFDNLKSFEFFSISESMAITDMKLVNKIQLVSTTANSVLGIPSPLTNIFLGPVGVVTTSENQKQIKGGTIIILAIGALCIAGVVYLWAINPKAAESACAEGCAAGIGESIGNYIGDECAKSISECGKSEFLLKAIFK